MQNPGSKSALGLDANVASLLAYIPLCLIGLIMSIIIVVTDKTNKLARFHAFQSILVHVIFILLYVVLMVVAVGAAAAGSTALSLLTTLLYIGGFLAFWAYASSAWSKPFRDHMLKLPVIGNMADSWSN